MKQPEQPWEFRSKPAWQRLLIMVGGVLFNFLLALFIYSMILFKWGDQYIPVQEAPLGMDFNETAKAVGFQDGDICCLPMEWTLYVMIPTCSVRLPMLVR